MRIFAVLTALALALMAVDHQSACTLAAPIAKNPFDQVVPLARIGDVVPPAHFIDQNGRRLALTDLRGNTIAIAFIYTRCKDACPVITQKMAQVREALDTGPFRIVEVTIDPVYDTRPKTSAYAREHAIDAPAWLVLTGQSDDVANFDRAMGVQVIEVGHGDVLHNDRVVIVAPDGTIADLIDGSSWTASDLAAQMRRVAGLDASWLNRLDLALGSAAAYCGSAVSGRSGVADLIASIAIFAVAAGIFIQLMRRLFAS